MSDELKELLKDLKSSLVLNDLDTCYNYIIEQGYEIDEVTPEFTRLLLDSGINPLDYLKYIPDYYMSGNKLLKNITISDNIKGIGNESFGSCSNLTEIKIPDNVEYIGDYGFAYCKNLKKVIIGNGCKNIGAYAFSDCPNLTEVTIPEIFKKRLTIIFGKKKQYLDRINFTFI